jgi:hypothetical protein
VRAAEEKGLAHQHGLLLGKIEHGLADTLVAFLRFDDVIG